VVDDHREAGGIAGLVQLEAASVGQVDAVHVRELTPLGQ
jgi:hypothetical protein